MTVDSRLSHVLANQRWASLARFPPLWTDDEWEYKVQSAIEPFLTPGREVVYSRVSRCDAWIPELMRGVPAFSRVVFTLHVAARTCHSPPVFSDYALRRVGAVG